MAFVKGMDFLVQHLNKVSLRSHDGLKVLFKLFAIMLYNLD